MERLNNMYYSKYESSIESETAYDSDNSDTYRRLIQSPSQAEFRRYIERRNDEELWHEYWKLKIREETNLAQEIKDQCGMSVNLADNRVYYVYRPTKDETTIPGIKFRITFIYIKLLRKWYISFGHSRLPEAIKLHNKIKRGTYNPVGPRVLEMMCKAKHLLSIFVQRLDYICNLVDNMKENYKDMEFQVNEPLTNVKIMLKEKAWPASLEKMSSEDIIILEFVLDENLEIDSLTYEYIHSKEVSAQQKQMCLSKLERKLERFFDLRLMEAFIVFMNEDYTY